MTKVTLLVFVVLVLPACTTLDVRTEHDPAVDFSRYRTFAFADPADIGEERTPQEAMLRDRIEPAVSRALTAKGLRQSGSDQQADLAVYYWVNVKATERKAWRRSYGWGFTYAGAVPTYVEREGTLILDLVEPIKRELVWRATMVALLEQRREDNVDLATKAVAQALAEYPPNPHHSR